MGQILIKRTDVLNKAPTTSQLEYGQLALNYASGSEALYIKNSNNQIVKLSGSGAGNQPPTNQYTILKPNTTSGDITLDLAAHQSFQIQLTTAITNVIFANPPVVSGNSTEYSIILIKTAARDINFPSTVIWTTGTAPSFNLPGVSRYLIKLIIDGTGQQFAFLLSGAETTDWNSIDNKPTTFAPIIGTTSTTAKAGNWVPTWDDIVGKPEISSSVQWDDVQNKPTTFAPTIGNTATTAKAGDWQPTWSGVTNKPTIFPSNWASVADKPTTFAPIIGTTATTAKAGNWMPAWGDISGKPVTATRWPAWEEVTNKPDFSMNHTIAAGGVGQYAFMVNIGSTTRSFGTVESGTYLRYASIGTREGTTNIFSVNQTQIATPLGTWRNLSAASNSSMGAGIWIRIS